MWGVRWTNIVRTAAVALATAAVGMSWWFVMFAGYTHLVYRADFPDWTLLPSAVAVVLSWSSGWRRADRAVDRARAGTRPRSPGTPPACGTGPSSAGSPCSPGSCS